MSVSQHPSSTFARRLGFAIILLSAGLASPTVGAVASGLGLEERIACEQAIQEVYYSHRTWPQDSAKPSFETAVPRDWIADKVRATEDKARLLDARWGYRIDGAQLQAEIERMAAKSRRPERLGELWAALGNDPLLIAECLARPLLVERRIRSFYRADHDLHAALRRKAEAELHAADGAWDLDMSGRVERIELRRASAKSDNGTAAPSVRVLDDAEFEAHALRLNLDRRIEPRAKARFAELQENDEAFWAEAVLDTDTDRIRLTVVHWPKRSFSEWFAEARATLAAAQPAAPVKMANDAFSLPKLGVAGCTDDTWSLIRPEGRKQHTAVWTGSEMIVWGGRSDIGMLRSGGRYDPVTDTWVTVETQGSPPLRDAHTAVWTGVEMIVWGGNFSGFPTATGYRYDPTSDTWSQVTTSGAPSARWGHTAVWAEEEGVMLVWGGITGCSGDTCTYIGTGGAYDPVSNTWSSLPAGLSARSGHTATWTAAGMMVWGGRDANGYLGDGSVLQGPVGSWVWIDLPTNGAPSPRAGHTVAWTGLQMIIWGGEDDSGPRADGARFIVFGWSPITAVDAPPGLVGHSATWVGSEMVVWGGEDGDGVMNGTIYRYVPDGSDDSWSVAGGSTVRRRDHTAVWTGDRLIAWGGEGVAGVVEDGRAFNPSSGSVTLVAGHQQPVARREHVAVWTGSEMLVWGGRTEAGRTASGGRYDPTTDTWAPLAIAGAPFPRNLSTAVWTGSEMLVWGGRDDFGYPGGGGRYNPTTDTWSLMSTTGAPAGREDHSAVWTGASMMIWGGRVSAGDGTHQLGDGARYSPALNAWFALPSVGAPSPRHQHTAVWAPPGRMVVWGGAADGSASAPALGDGAIYHTATQSWSPMAATGARKGHSATWTGSEMLVFGFNSGLSHYGERYDPGADAWSPIPGSDDASYSLLGHRAVWTGQEWILWGGLSGTGAVAPVRYDRFANTLSLGTLSGRPGRRTTFSAVWTGREMMVWGGLLFSLTRPSNDGGAYCVVNTRVFANGFEN